MDELLRTIAVYALPVLFAITLHEAAHAYAAKYFGDNTAYAAGRMSLDPFKHIDPVGTILMPLALYILSKGTFVFGYAKPVPVDFDRLRNPKRQMAWVALAGPGSNFLMAFGWLLLGLFAIASGGPDGFLYEIGVAGVKVNLLMFAFNLVPIPPLDGGRVLTSILPNPLASKFARIEPYGMFIVIGLVLMHMLDFWVIQLMHVSYRFLDTLSYPVKLLLS
jgi:Zn-dependent protease